MKQVINEVQTLKSPPFRTLVCTIASATKFSYHWWQLLMYTLWSMIVIMDCCSDISFWFAIIYFQIITVIYSCFNDRWSYADEIWTFGYIKLHIWKCWSDLFLCYHNIFPFFSCSCSLSLSLSLWSLLHQFIHLYTFIICGSLFYDFLAFRRWIELFPHSISMLKRNV